MSKKFATIHHKAAPVPARMIVGLANGLAGREAAKGAKKSIKSNKETFPFMTENL